MPILNYTTKVPVENTLKDIERILIKAGANGVLKEYEGGEVAAVTFRVIQENGGDRQEIFYKLPADIEGVSRALKKDREFRDTPHARRVAWRIVKDWIEAQMAIVQAQMAELPQVFLPYAQTSTGQSVYEKIKETKNLMITGPK